MESNLAALASFTEENLPTLDVVTLGALELFYTEATPQMNFNKFARPLVVGSGNAASVGKLLFDDVDAVFADESSYLQKLSSIKAIDGAFVLSASGSKHAVEIVKELTERNIPTILLTNNPDAPAKEFLPESSVCVYPKNREPYTYNTSTYMGMLLSKTHEDAEELSLFIEREVLPKLPSNFSSYSAFYLIVPSLFTHKCSGQSLTNSLDLNSWRVYLPMNRPNMLGQSFEVIGNYL